MFTTLMMVHAVPDQPSNSELVELENMVDVCHERIQQLMAEVRELRTKYTTLLETHSTLLETHKATLTELGACIEGRIAARDLV